MGSIYPHCTGRRDTGGYDSYDFDKLLRPSFMNVYKWIVRTTHSRRSIYATTLDGAKAEACNRFGWPPEDIIEVYAIGA